MPLQPPEKPSFTQKLATAQSWTRLPALTIIVVLRRDLGFRLLNPLPFFAMTGILALVAILAMPGSPNGGPLAMLLFAVLSFICGMSQRMDRWRELNRNVRSHSYYLGSSPFDYKWLPEFCRRNRRVARFFDPIFCALVGYVLLPSLPALALWLVFAGLCLRVFEDAVFIRERNRELDISDSLIISQRCALVIDQTEHTATKNQPPQQGIPAGLGPDIAGKVNIRKMKNNSMKCQQHPAVSTPCFPSNTANKQQKHSKNMSTTNLPSNVWKKVFDLAETMPPLRARKSPVAAAALGFAFGGIGLGIYFGTILDFVVPFILLVILFFMAFPTGGLPCFCCHLYALVGATNEPPHRMRGWMPKRAPCPL